LHLQQIVSRRDDLGLGSFSYVAPVHNGFEDQ
jgi:hypothetical protein